METVRLEIVENVKNSNCKKVWILEHGHFYNGNCGKKKLWSLEAIQIEWTLWKMENFGYGNCWKWKLKEMWKLTKIEIVENGNYGKLKLWEIEILEKLKNSEIKIY